MIVMREFVNRFMIYDKEMNKWFCKIKYFKKAIMFNWMIPALRKIY